MLKHGHVVGYIEARRFYIAERQHYRKWGIEKVEGNYLVEPNIFYRFYNRFRVRGGFLVAQLRDFEMCRLVLDASLKKPSSDQINWREWSRNGRVLFRQYYKRTATGLTLYEDIPNATEDCASYEIQYHTLPLTYGKRYQFICPRCENKARILYLRDGRFACRECQHVTYESTHAAKLDALMSLIQKQRVKAYGKELLNYYQPEYCCITDWIPKPKYKHQTTFLRETKKLFELEERLIKEATATFPDFFKNITND